MRELLSVFYRLDRRRQGKPNLPPLDVYGSVRIRSCCSAKTVCCLAPDTSYIFLQIYEKWKSDVVTLERIILRSFGFILHVEHPHKYVLNYMVILEVHDIPESGLLQQAWNLANDRYVLRLSSSTVFTVLFTIS